MNITKKNVTKFLLSVEILTLEGGLPNYNDLLYIPKDEDIEKYLAHKKAKENINNILFEEDENKNEIKEDIDYVKKCNVGRY